MTELEQSSQSPIAALREMIRERRIQSGIAYLESNRGALAALDPEGSGAAQLIWRLAEWSDVGWQGTGLVQELLERFPKGLRTRLPLADYAALRLAAGLVAMSREEANVAVGHFETVFLLEKDLESGEMAAIAHYWQARCLRKKGEYKGALQHAVQAREISLGCGFGLLAAVIRVLESWLFFQEGKHKEALKLLAEAENVLSASDDFIVRGNIQSTYGRIFRNEGRYDRAIQHFSCAMEEYRRVDPRHPHLARTLCNIAFAKRLLALDLRRKIESDLARRRQGGAASREPGAEHANYREQFAKIRDEALEQLDKAAEICSVHPNHRSAGTVHLNRGLLQFDSGALDVAEEEGQRAFACGEAKQDFILMARARVLACMVENAKLEEGIDDDPRQHAQAALDHVRDAIGYAQATQSRHLLARVHTWHGLTLSNEFFRQDEAAAEALNLASNYVDYANHDSSVEDLQRLRARLSKVRPLDATLRAWSEGAIGKSTFKELSEEFASIVIPRIWELEGRKIARVAARLAISPKKVRRALSRAGVLPHHQATGVNHARD